MTADIRAVGAACGLVLGRGVRSERFSNLPPTPSTPETTTGDFQSPTREAAAAARLKRQAEHDARAVERIKPYLVDQGLSCQATADVLNLGGSERHGYTDHMSHDWIAIGG